MSAPATVVVVPRERFSFAERSLASVLRETPPETPLVYVDGGSPPRVRDAIRALLAPRRAELIRSERYLSPNEARNLGYARVRTPYAVFIDNDVLASPGWLGRLVACAAETGADVVGPLYLIGSPARGAIHMAGGEARIVERDGVRALHEAHRLCGKRLPDVAASLRRGPCELVEFHCMLVRREAMERCGPFDERLLSTHEHVDFCLAVRAGGGSVWFEPASVVAYVPPPPFRRGDRRFYLLRWSRRWNWESVRHFARKWNLDDRDEALRPQLGFVEMHRKAALGRFVKWATRPFGRRYDNWIANGLDRGLELLVTRRDLRAFDAARSAGGAEKA